MTGEIHRTHGMMVMVVLFFYRSGLRKQLVLGLKIQDIWKEIGQNQA
jgi:hypothetical protein